MTEISEEVKKLADIIDKNLAFKDIKIIEEQLEKTKIAGFKIGETIYASHQHRSNSAEE